MSILKTLCGCLIRFMALSCAIMFLSIAAFADWHMVQPIEYQASINSVDRFAMSLTVLAAADSGVIFRSTDTGNTWGRSSIGSQNLNAVACSEQDLAIIVGDDGKAVITYNSGGAWVSILNLTTEDLSAVDIFGNMQFIVGGGDGVIKGTTNGGFTWFSATTPGSSTIKALNYVSEDTIYAAASRQIWLSVDGGRNWSVVSTLGEFIEDIDFLDSQVGFACGGWETVYRTTNGGTSWDSVMSVYTNPVSVVAESQNNVNVLTEEGDFCYTSGSFYSWHRSPIGGGFSKMINVAGFSQFIAVGGYGNWDHGPGAIVAKSTDEGVSWSYKLFCQQVIFRSIYFADDSRGWLAGGTPSYVNASYPEFIMNTTDGGLTWDFQMKEAGSGGLAGICFVDSLTGFACGSGRLWRTTNGGDNWNSRVMAGMNDLSFINGQEGWCCGFDGRIYHTTNSGGAWTTRNSPSQGDYLYSICFVDENNGWCSGYNWYQPFRGIILHTTNGGLIWEYQLEDTNSNNIQSMQMWDSQQGIGVGTAGGIYKTTDGGSSWSKMQVQNAPQLSSVMYENQYRIWAAGADGYIICSLDGGANWSIDTTLAGYDLNDVFVYQNQKYVVTEDGMVFYNFDPTFIENPDAPIPAAYSLYQAYPNPFNLTTTIAFSIAEPLYVKLTVYDLLGREIRIISEGEKPAGNYNILFNGSELSSGVYFYRLQAGDYSLTKRMVLLK